MPTKEPQPSQLVPTRLLLSSSHPNPNFQYPDFVGYENPIWNSQTLSTKHIIREWAMEPYARREAHGTGKEEPGCESW